MIVIEGSDGCGKTTAAKRLCELSGGALSYRHLGPPPLDTNHVSLYLDEIGPYVWDRFHLGEEAYGLLGLSHRGSQVERELVRAELRRRKVLVIVMYASKVTDLKTEDRSELYSQAQIERVNEVYRTIVWTQLNWYDIAWNVSWLGWPDDEALTEWLADEETKCH